MNLYEKKGFTLIELLAVIVILAIIALIAMPMILGYVKRNESESNQFIFGDSWTSIPPTYSGR